MRRLRLGLALGAVAVAATAGTLLAAGGEEGAGARYRIVFDNAFGIVEGGDFRVGGVTAGQTTDLSVEKRPGRAARAVVTAEITEPGFADFRADASCAIRPQSLIGEYYVDCQPGSSPERLGAGGTVPVERTESTIPPDLVSNILRRPYRERFRLILTELGTGLAGRPADLQAVLRRAHPGLRETTRVLGVLARQNRVIERFVADSDDVIRDLAARRGEVARWVRETRRAGEVSASRREDLRRTFARLPVFLDELRPTARNLRRLADAQVPLLAELERSAPSVRSTLERLGPLARAARPAVRSLGPAAREGGAAFRAAGEELTELRALARDAGPFARPLRQFLETMDDRRRALEDDERATASAPPAPDPTAVPAGDAGFTGFESLWNYPYWQTLSINNVDDVGHLLRIGITATKCTPYRNSAPETEEDRRLFEECNSWTGPDQPGITTPDFTDQGSVRAARRPARRIGERRRPGAPDAGPLPGQRDISRPQLAVPPGLRRLERLPLPEGRVVTPPEQLLDYLLAP